MSQSDRSGADDRPSAHNEGREQSDPGPQTSRSPGTPGPRSDSSSRNGSEMGGLFISMGSSGSSLTSPPRQPEPTARAASEPAKDKAERPILRLAMLNAQEKAKVQARVQDEHSATAPVVSRPMELPDTGYFAPRVPIVRANSLSASPSPLIVRHSPPSEHSTTDNNGSVAPESSGLRRRLTRAKATILRLGRSQDARDRNVSDTESEPDSDHERRMEKLFDAHANTAETAPTNNIDANNAEITNPPGFYPINLSMENPGVVHMNMSGHQAAKNIVDSVLGTIGTSTSQYKKLHPGSGDMATDVTPSDLEAGVGKRVKFAEGSSSARPGGRSHHHSAETTARQSPRIGSSSPQQGMPIASAASLRGVYANLSKLQSRMVEHQEKREHRMREIRIRDELRRKEEAERETRRQQQQRKDESHTDDRHKTRARELLERERAALSTVGTRLREIPARIPECITGKRRGHSRSRSGTQTPPAPTTENKSATYSDDGSRNGFVLHSFQAVPRPASIANLTDLFGTALHSHPLTSASIDDSPPLRGAIHSPALSPLTTPGWDEIVASSGMLSGGPGSRMSMASVDTTMQSFDIEKQKILSQLADIFNRQNYLLVASRALMGFGAPLHRLEANLVAIAINLDVAATFAVLPGIILITFGDEDTRTSETYVVRMTPGYDMHRLERTNRTIRRVLKGRISVGKGVKEIERILATPPLYPWWAMIMDYVVCSFFICPLFWSGSWRDASISAMLGLIVGLLQLTAGRFANYANLFEVSSAFIVSFIAALLQDYVCFGTVSFSGIAMLLPGLALTTSIIEMASRNMITGTVRFIFAMCRCFMLGYGISVGSTLGTRVLGRSTSVDLLADQMNSTSGLGNCNDGVNKYWWFLFLPVLSLSFNMSISAHWRQWPIMLIAGCLAYTVSYFSALSEALAPLAPAIAAFAMGLFANGMATFSNHRSAIEPILGGVQLLVPGSLGLRTVLAFITSSGNSSGNFLYDMFSTSLSIAVGLFLSGMVVFPNRKKRVGLMTF
ncbi:pheromone-regulated protein prm10 [Coemansia pectinata]|uniref:Pheromone-regulated protein prm10 n=1 Tax=Coemansia pectinata TaxID=1052879 RepID=A0A9W8GW97_9FUNG|nr:pheromone-regulated protein prm10 [Coemansia pectinata]